MSELEQYYLDKTLKMKPIESGNSLHVQHFVYHIDQKKVSFFYAISSDSEPLIEIEDESKIDWKKAYYDLLEEKSKEIKKPMNKMAFSRGHF